MEIKRLDNTIIDSEHNSKKATKDNNTTFLETLTQLVAKSTITKLSSGEKTNLQNDKQATGIPTIDALTEANRKSVLKCIQSLNDIFKINILQNKDEFFDKDSRINVHHMIDNYGDNVKDCDLINLSMTITSLLDNGMISNEDYIYALKWIATRKQAARLKQQIENTKNKVIDLITYKPKELEHKII